MDAGTAARIARLAVDAPGNRVLEVGAGTGSLTAALLAAGADLTAFDLDDALIECCAGATIWRPPISSTPTR